MSKNLLVLSGEERAVVEEEEEQEGKWEGLNPEILASIFVRMPADEMVRTVSLVCKPWMETVAGPYCWRIIDVDAWCRRRNGTHAVDLAVVNLLGRSNSTCYRLSAYRLGYPGFSSVANCGRCLKVLQIPNSEITDHMVLKHVESLSNLTVLDISHCCKITAKGLKAFGNHCRSLVDLKRNLHPPEDWGTRGQLVPRQMDDTEAKVIADTMLNLQHLELCFGRFGDAGLSEIVSKCKSLSHLDIQGSWNVKLKGDLKESCKKLGCFQGPCFHEHCDRVCPSFWRKLLDERAKQRVEPVIARLDIMKLNSQCLGDAGLLELLLACESSARRIIQGSGDVHDLKLSCQMLEYFQSRGFREYCDEICKLGTMKLIDERLKKTVEEITEQIDYLEFVLQMTTKKTSSMAD